MTKIVRLEPPKRAKSFFKESNTNSDPDSCEFTFNPDEWMAEHGRKADLKENEIDSEGNWSCSLPKWNNKSTCIFHTPIDEKPPSEVCIELRKYISEGHINDGKGLKIIGGEYGLIDIRELVKISNHNFELHLRNSLFTSEIYFGDVTLPTVDFSGSTFRNGIAFKDSTIHGDLRMSNTHLGGETSKNIIFDGVTITGDIDLNNSNVEQGVIMYDVSGEGGVDFRKSAFHNGVDLFESDFKGKVEFFQSNILESIDADEGTSLRIHDCLFDSVVHLQGIYTNGNINGEKTEYRGGIVLLHSYPENIIDLSESYIKDTATFFGMQSNNTQIKLRGSRLEGDIIISSIKFEDPEDVFLYVQLEGSYISSGRIYQPNTSAEIYCSLERATVGDVDLKYQNESAVLNPSLENVLRYGRSNHTYESVFDYLSIYDTDFVGFDFGDYREDLENVGWNIHQSRLTSPEREITLGIQRIEGENSQKINQNIRVDLSSSELLERTYLKAKNGAKDLGDEIAASNFLIKEMRHRKNRYRENTKEMLIFPNTINDLIFGLKYLIQWVINSILETASAYGERIWPVLVYSLIFIVQCALLLPFRDGFENAEQTISYSAVNNGSISVTELMSQSLYYSSVTFTTIGSGGYRPNIGFSQMIVAVESFFGALFIALLVFALGKRVSR